MKSHEYDPSLQPDGSLNKFKEKMPVFVNTMSCYLDGLGGTNDFINRFQCW